MAGASSNTSRQNRTKSSWRNAPTADYEVAVIGAGPYGLAAAAHLQAKKISTRVFGQPMDFWAQCMPEGMLLRSPRVASNISDPEGILTLDAYESATRKEPLAPIPLDAFVAYGRWFKERIGAELDSRNVASIRRDPAGFLVAVETGEQIRFKRVVIAAGVCAFKRTPEVFRRLDSSRVSHTYGGRDTRRFAGKGIAVIGGGQSALEWAALLRESGAEVEVIAKSPRLRWIGQHPWLHRLGPISSMLYSDHDVGPAGISRLVSMPKLIHRIPLQVRDRIRTRAVRPAGAKWLPERLKGVRVGTGLTVADARPQGDGVALKLDDGSERSVDHVLLGTGYSVDVSRYEFLSPELLGAIRRQDGYPVLTSGFLSSVPGLHFIGATAARSFGPLLYFVAGTAFASSELTSNIVRAGGGHR